MPILYGYFFVPYSSSLCISSLPYRTWLSESLCCQSYMVVSLFRTLPGSVFVPYPVLSLFPILHGCVSLSMQACVLSAVPPSWARTRGVRPSTSSTTSHASPVTHAVSITSRINSLVGLQRFETKPISVVHLCGPSITQQRG